MRRNRDLESRLVEWGKEYGGGRYGRIGGGTSWLASMVHWGGRAPTGLNQVLGNNAADEVQEAVTALDKKAPDGFFAASVIRCEYLTPGQPMQMKLDRLRSIGQSFGRTTYYERLRVARKFVAEFLNIPYDAPESAGVITNEMA